MKKSLFFILILIIIIAMSTGSVLAETDFRGVSWGMSEEEVTNIEGIPDRTEEDLLIYDIEISGVDLLLRYKFIEDTLVQATFYNNENYIDNSQYYNDYQTLNNSLKQVHGDPQKEIANWDSSMAKAMHSEKMGFELNMVEFLTNWEKERFSINHILTNEDFSNAVHAFIYESLVPEHQELIKTTEQEELEQQL